MGVLEYSVWIEAAPEQVWHTYVDPLRLPDWQTGRPAILDVQGAPGESGSTYVSKRGALSAYNGGDCRLPARSGDEHGCVPRPVV